MNFEPSKFQKEIFDFVKNGEGNGIIEAVAGSGKTTTILEAAKHVKPDSKVLFMAFNRAIVQEIKSKLPKTTKALTFNGLGHKSLCQNLGSVRLDANKDMGIFKDLETDYAPAIKSKLYEPVRKLCSLAKYSGIVPEGYGNSITPDHYDSWKAVMEHHDVDVDDALDLLMEMENITDKDDEEVEERALVEEAIRMTREILIAGLECNEIVDFNDQLYFPVAKGYHLEKFDVIFVDEAQDLSIIQRELIKQALKKDGRVIAVGDTFQAIYGFRGADSSSMANTKEEFDCTPLPLSITYRCPKVITKKAQEYVKHIECPKDAKNGVLENKGIIQDCKLNPRDMVICRVNASLMRVAHNLIQKKVPFHYLGQDFVKGLVTLLDKVSKKENMDIETFEKRLERWYNIQLVRAQRRKKGEGAIRDKYESFQIILDSFGAKDTDHLKVDIERVFRKPYGDSVILSTIHKAKGLEAPTVYYLNSHIGDYFIAQSGGWAQQQEYNMHYVAVTRAIDNLYYVKTRDQMKFDK